MIQKSLRVLLELRIDKNVSREIAEAVFFRINPHQSEFTAKRLDEAGVTVESLSKYYEELCKAVAEFWNNCWDMTATMTLKAHEMRGLYLPLVYATVLASVGNLKKGNYEYVIKAKADEKPDRKFLIDFSAKLEGLRDIVKGNVGQLGNRSASAQDAVMMCLVSEVSEDGRTAEMLIRDGVTVDNALAGFATLIGLSLVEEAYRIMYTGVEEINFRQLIATLMEKSVATKTEN